MDEQTLCVSILQNINDGVYFVDKERNITFWNKSAERITGFTASEVIHTSCYQNLLNHVNEEGEEICKNGCPLHKTMQDGITREGLVYLHHKNGYRIPVQMKSIAIMENLEIVGAMEIFHDYTEQNTLLHQLEELKSLALRDQLTNLPNRRYIESFLELKKNDFMSFGIPFGIAFIDLDRFKSINDQYGHNIGDEVLQVAAKTFSRMVRNSDLIGRWGGEEFLGVFCGVDMDSLRKICTKLKTMIEKSSISRDIDLKITISIGATLFRLEDTIEQAIQRADQFLYKSKEAGRNRVTTDDNK
ncbi:GGDEF domain-containing protein [Anaeromicropila populeti]|uniref:PAS domain S-box-containing protein/diguanylate cyclase (GGDEF) domain-containing protein n=1 Tax=Anaeromicropila populeti TaxID=37658 RepID=A0A1I6KZQ9_9FIRM|nr:GGDEF domain-containing protein [Anaeromicropila populeti]SFR96723.1 PAS domain S-box-containing protein/diguanylate cyclase (GGDEF) domain-containing protein [Anaeromicropila populeti]